MSLAYVRKLQKGIKDLILFNSSWNKRSQIIKELKLSKGVINKIKIYRDLVNHSLRGVVTSIYPLTKYILKKDWSRLVNKYLEVYPHSSPILNRVAKDFPKYLSKQESIVSKYPFVYELALYEWLELEVYEKENVLVNDRKKPCLNPIHVICPFQYPIHKVIERIKDDKLVTKIDKKHTNILIYRDPKTLKVRFFELEPGALAYVKLLKSGLKEDLILRKLVSIFNVSSYQVLKKRIVKLKKVLKKNTMSFLWL